MCNIGKRFYNAEGPIKVSVCMITYNHELFIKQALESVLKQVADFKYEIVIGDDFSQDNTVNILREFQAKYGDKIRLFLNKKNLGAQRNFFNVFRACRGNYIALLEGDDFWSSFNKLQTQADFLDRHPEFSMCFTNSSIVDENDNIININRLNDDRKRILRQIDIISGFIPPTNTIMIKNYIKEFPDEYFTIVNGDLLLCAMITEDGDAGYINENTACYRIHAKGLWSTQPKEYQMINYLKTYMALLSLFRHKYEHIIIQALNNGYANLLKLYKDNDFQQV